MFQICISSRQQQSKSLQDFGCIPPKNIIKKKKKESSEHEWSSNEILQAMVYTNQIRFVQDTPSYKYETTLFMEIKLLYILKPPILLAKQLPHITENLSLRNCHGQNYHANQIQHTYELWFSLDIKKSQLESSTRNNTSILLWTDQHGKRGWCQQWDRREPRLQQKWGSESSQQRALVVVHWLCYTE